jgi:osmotically-inducible protein OsmY
MSRTHTLRGLIGAAAAALPLAAPALADQPQDAWITTQVKLELLSAEEIDALAINVDTFDGDVTLHGAVEAPEQQEQAERLAGSVEGVRKVRNLLAVVPGAAKPSVEASDRDLRARVENVLERDAALEASEIRVKSVHDGIVVLSGRAETPSAHRRALEDARSVDGVRQVASEIRSPNAMADLGIWSEVGSTEPTLADAASDTWITSQAKVRLMVAPGISPLAVNVDTRNGVVTLFGQVESAEQKDAAERELGRISGVKGVENELQVVPDVVAKRIERQDDQVENAVRKRMDEREVLRDADVEIEVENGVVRLTGSVASHADKMQMLMLARTTEGVDSIVDGLRVRPAAGG